MCSLANTGDAWQLWARSSPCRIRSSSISSPGRPGIPAKMLHISALLRPSTAKRPYAKSDVPPEGNCLIGATVLPWRFFPAWSHGRGYRTFSTRGISSVDYNRERRTGKRRKTQPLKNHVAYWSEHNTKINTHLQQYFWINKTFYVLLLFAVKTNRLSWGARRGIFGPR